MGVFFHLLLQTGEGHFEKTILDGEQKENKVL